ncbi:hypothetical protein MAM1_0898c11345 [Mucor ambiguus]|uniref:DNA helicase Pif1-like 2B domain-containing protein n=1 Tax=Mucor ambiguus TaxID=91626 RepID=A0A0C9MWN4_9FUNG|nr:hypothetical protein MAM1_0898c11345 [Mucor ambiguus]
MIVPGDNMFDLLQSVCPDITNHANDLRYSMRQASLTSMNRVAKTINELSWDCIQGRKVSYISIDWEYYNKDQLQISVELLDMIEGGSLPLHVLGLKIGSPITVIRNIDPAAGVCNGMRLIVNSLGATVIETIIATGPKAGNKALISKIKFITFATEGVSLYVFQRIQFSVILAFILTTNKPRSQTLNYAGLFCIYLKTYGVYFTVPRLKPDFYSFKKKVRVVK